MAGQDAEFGRAVVRPILLVAFILVQAFLVVFPRYDTLDLEAWPNTQPSPRLFGTRTVGQTFVPKINSLSRIDVFMATHKIVPKADLIFRLYGGAPEGRPIVEIRIPGSKLNDNLFHPIEFPRIPRSRGKRFSFTLSMPDAAETEGSSLWTNPADVMSSGSLLIDGRPAGGDGIFRTYSRRTILSEWERISAGVPGRWGNPFLLALAALLFEIAAAAAFWWILGLFFRDGETPHA